ncbi:hypothetical protein ScPMuIL_003030 [Solemya velum]
MSTNPKIVVEHRFGFGFVALKKFPELIPLCAIMTVAIAGTAAFIGYALKTKPDIRINKNVTLPPWERVSPDECKKMIRINQEYKPIPELEKLKKEIGSFKY